MQKTRKCMLAISVIVAAMLPISQGVSWASHEDNHGPATTGAAVALSKACIITTGPITPVGASALDQTIQVIASVGITCEGTGAMLSGPASITLYREVNTCGEACVSYCGASCFVAIASNSTTCSATSYTLGCTVSVPATWIAKGSETRYVARSSVTINLASPQTWTAASPGCAFTDADSVGCTGYADLLFT